MEKQYDEQEYVEFASSKPFSPNKRQRISCQDFFNQINPPRPRPLGSDYESNLGPCKVAYERVPTEFLIELLRIGEKNEKTAPIDLRLILEMVNGTYERTSEQEHKHVLELTRNRDQLKKTQDKQRYELREKLLKQEHELEMIRIKAENETKKELAKIDLQKEELRLSTEKAREKTKTSAVKQTRWLVILFLGILLFILFFFRGFSLSYHEYQLGPQQQNTQTPK